MVAFDLTKTAVVILTIMLFLYGFFGMYNIAYNLKIIPHNAITSVLYTINLTTLINGAINGILGLIKLITGA